MSVKKIEWVCLLYYRLPKEEQDGHTAIEAARAKKSRAQKA